MSDLANRKYYTSDFIGLTTNAYILAAAGTLCLVFYELARNVRRKPRSSRIWAWKFRADRADHPPPRENNSRLPLQWDPATGRVVYASSPDTGPDDWEMAHLYTPRQYHAATPSPPLSRWPLLWIWRAFMLNDWWYATHVGIDALVYVRFLRAAAWWMFVHLLTTTPVLLGIHFRYSACESRTDMACASLSYLVTSPADPAKCSSLERASCARVNNEVGRRYLWVHLVVMNWITFTWIIALCWLAKGVINTRRQLILNLRTKTVHRLQSAQQRDSTGHASFSNANSVLQGAQLCPSQPNNTFLSADEQTQEKREQDVGDELDRLAGRADDGAHPFHSTRLAQSDPSLAGWRQRTLMLTNLPKHMRNEKVLTALIEQQLGLQGGLAGWRATDTHNHFLPSPVQEVILVRKMAGLESLVERREAALFKLEMAHMELADNILSALGNDQKDGAFVMEKTPDDRMLAQSLARFVKVPPHQRQSQHPSTSVSLEPTFWHELHALPREVLDRYQPTVRLSSGPYKGACVPTIDLLLTKLNLLTALVDAARRLPETEWDPTPVAFVTFRDPRQARLLWREMGNSNAPLVHLAPERRDLIWDRLMHTTFASRLVRGAGVSSFFWLFTLFWMIPTQAAASVLTNIGGITRVSDSASRAFQNHNEGLRFVSGTLPTLLVSGIMLLVPEFIFQVHLRAHQFLTRTELYDQCLCRYWKFVVCNTVILFSVGSATLETILVRIGSHHQGSILTSIAFAFPSAAPFFCSYLMLNIATQTGAELVQAVIGLFQAVQAMSSGSPRDRKVKILPRKFGHAIWMPLHLTALTMVFIFAIFNPLVVCFGMVYLWCALIVFKKDLAYVYVSRFHENQGEIFFKRMLRFSLDAFVVAQIVLAIFFAVTKVRAVYLAMTILLIPFTVVVKLVGTRLWQSQVRSLDDDEANALCGIDDTPSWLRLRAEYAKAGLAKDVALHLAAHLGKESHPHQPRPVVSRPYRRSKFIPTAAAILTEARPENARAAGRYPVRLPGPSQFDGKMMGWLHWLLDRFCADGNDMPGWVSLFYSNERRAQLEQQNVKLDTRAPAVLRTCVATFHSLHNFVLRKAKPESQPTVPRSQRNEEEGGSKRSSWVILNLHEGADGASLYPPPREIVTPDPDEEFSNSLHIPDGRQPPDADNMLGLAYQSAARANQSELSFPRDYTNSVNISEMEEYEKSFDRRPSIYGRTRNRGKAPQQSRRGFYPAGASSPASDVNEPPCLYGPWRRHDPVDRPVSPGPTLYSPASNTSPLPSSPKSYHDDRWDNGPYTRAEPVTNSIQFRRRSEDIRTSSIRVGPVAGLSGHARSHSQPRSPPIDHARRESHSQGMRLLPSNPHQGTYRTDTVDGDLPRAERRRSQNHLDPLAIPARYPRRYGSPALSSPRLHVPSSHEQSPCHIEVYMGWGGKYAPRRPSSPGLAGPSKSYCDSPQERVPPTAAQPRCVEGNLIKLAAAGLHDGSTAGTLDQANNTPVLAARHPPIIWDDRPDNLAQYPSPAYCSTMDRHLWLPRDPRDRLNVCDTIDWYGPAFVSSQFGGAGTLCVWHGAIPWTEKAWNKGDWDRSGCNTPLAAPSEPPGASFWAPAWAYTSVGQGLYSPAMSRPSDISTAALSPLNTQFPSRPSDAFPYKLHPSFALSPGRPSDVSAFPLFPPIGLQPPNASDASMPQLRPSFASRFGHPWDASSSQPRPSLGMLHLHPDASQELVPPPPLNGNAKSRKSSSSSVLTIPVLGKSGNRQTSLPLPVLLRRVVFEEERRARRAFRVAEAARNMISKKSSAGSDKRRSMRLAGMQQKEADVTEHAYGQPQAATQETSVDGIY